WLAPRPAPREKRERPGQRGGCSCRQGKTPPPRLPDRFAPHHGLASPRPSPYPHHPPRPLPAAPPQSTEPPALRPPSAHSLLAGISRLRCCFPTRSQRGVTDHRGHVTASLGSSPRCSPDAKIASAWQAPPLT